MFNANWNAVGITENAVYVLVGGGLMLAACALQKLRQKRRRLTAAMLTRVLGEYAKSGKFAPGLKAIGILLAAALVLAGPAHSATIFNGTPSIGGGGLVIDTFEGAEFFTLSAAETIRGIEFANQEYTPTFNDTLNYFIYANNGFFPGALLAQGTNPIISKSFVSNGGTLGVSIVKYDFNLITPVTLSAGKYWVGLNFSGGGFPVWDETTTPGAQLSAGLNLSTGNWNLDAVQLYLGVSDTPLVAQTPEPGTILFAGLGLVAVVWCRVRRQASLMEKGAS